MKKEEARIRDVYARQSEDDIRSLQGEEERWIGRITEACGKNVSRVAEYVAREIVKD